MLEPLKCLYRGNEVCYRSRRKCSYNVFVFTFHTIARKKENINASISPKEETQNQSKVNDLIFAFLSPSFTTCWTEKLWTLFMNPIKTLEQVIRMRRWVGLKVQRSLLIFGIQKDESNQCSWKKLLTRWEFIFLLRQKLEKTPRRVKL